MWGQPDWQLDWEREEEERKKEWREHKERLEKAFLRMEQEAARIHNSPHDSFLPNILQVEMRMYNMYACYCLYSILYSLQCFYSQAFAILPG